MIIPWCHAKMRNAYVLYTFKDCETKKVVFLSFEKLTKLFEFRKISGNPFFKHDKLYEVEIISWHSTLEEATLAWRNFDYTTIGGMPVMNIHYFPAHKALLMNEQTKEVYQSATVACKKYNISPSRMSQHIRRLPGYKTVGGYTWRYITIEQLQKMYNGAFDIVRMVTR